jgi:cytochrome c biogenesis protein CcdA
MDIPFALAFTAGLVATLNPCGFAMLPAYLSYFMGLEEDQQEGASHRGLQALKVGAVVSAGFMVVFGLAGILITLGVQAVVEALPWIAIVVGVGVVGLGAAMLAGRELRVSLPKATRAPSGRGIRGVFWFGISYAVASLSCTLPVFLVVVAGTIPQLGFLEGVATFLVYGAGMATLLLLVTLALAFGKQALVTRLRRGSAAVNRISGGILIIAGGYIVFFWVTTLRGGGLTQSAAVRWVEQLSSRTVNVVADAAVPIGVSAGLVLSVVLVASWVGVRRTRRHHLEVDPPDGGGQPAPDDHIAESPR